MTKTTRVARAAGAYLAVAAVTLVAVFVVLKMWRADLAIPFQSGGDTTFQQVLFKAIGQGEWTGHHPLLGMPDGADHRDYPMPENLQYAAIKILSLFIHDSVVVFNLFFLLTFPLIALSATAVCRRFGLTFVVSGLVGMLFALLPYHFFRGQGHLMLSMYALVPPVVLAAWWLAQADAVFFPALAAPPSPAPALPDVRRRFRWRSPRAAASLGLCVLVASAGVYYAAFSGFLLSVAGVWAACARRRIYPAVAAAVLVGVLLIGLLANLSPSLVYMARNGRNPAAAMRVAGEAEFYGLKIAPLVLPVPHHRVAVFRQLMDRYWQGPLNNENAGAALGFVGACGFLLLLGGLFRARAVDRPDSLRDMLPRLNIAAVLFGTIGGFGSLVALLLTPMLRGYNRISVFIGFFALVQIGMILDRLRERFFDTRSKREIFVVLLAALGVAAIADQTSEYFVPRYAAVAAQYQRNDEFIHRVEAALPAGSMVFQLPYMQFPEDRVFALESYAPLVPYLHARSLRWTFGAMRGRETDIWQRDIAVLPIDEFLESVAAAGFAAIYLDRAGYEDRGAATEKRLGELLGMTPLVNADQTVVVFPVLDWMRRHRADVGEEAWAGKVEAVRHPVVSAAWLPGFSDLEVLGQKTWRWCSQAGTLRLVNRTDRARDLQIDMIVSTGHAEPALVNIQIGAGPEESIQVDRRGRPYSRRFTLPPGTTEMKFSSSAPPVVAPGDERTLVFRLDSFRKQLF